MSVWLMLLKKYGLEIKCLYWPIIHVFILMAALKGQRHQQMIFLDFSENYV
jgi:hypothetical protein